MAPANRLLVHKYFFIFGFYLLPSLVSGGVYQWVDESGRVHFGSIPPHQQSEYKTGEITHEAPAAPEKESRVQAEKKKSDDEKSAATLGTLKEDPKTTKKEITPKFYDKHELKVLIDQLREKLKETNMLKAREAKSETVAPSSKILDVSESDKKIEIETATDKGEAKNIKQSSEPEKVDVSNKSDDKTVNEPTEIPVNKKQDAPAKGKSEKDEDKCGVFSGFVATYEQKIIDECPGSHCSVYKRSLKRYKVKQKRYCN